MKKQLLLLVMMFLPMVALADKSGTCGDNLTWTLEESTGTLTISGSGAMKDYSPSSFPWYNDETKILIVIIEDGVTSIGDYAFYKCSSLTSVTIGNSVTSIGREAFFICSSLTSVAIGNSVTSIGSYAFYNCSGLTSVTIGNSVTSIGSYAFSYCSGLTSVTIGNSVTSIGEKAFDSCDKISNVNISVSDFAAFCNNKIVYLIYKALSNPTNVTISLFDSEGKEIQDYIIPDGVTSIPIYAFYNCSSLKSIEIPNSVTTIKDRAFADCI